MWLIKSKGRLKKRLRIKQDSGQFSNTEFSSQGSQWKWRANHSLSFGSSSLVAQRLKHLPAMQETWVRSLGREDPLEKETATHSSILAWRIPWTEEPGGRSLVGYSPWGHKESDTTERFHFLSLLLYSKVIPRTQSDWSNLGHTIAPWPNKASRLTDSSTHGKEAML